MNAKNLSKKWCLKNGIAIMSDAECAESLKIAVPNSNDEFLLEKIRFVTQQRIIPEQHSPAEIRLMHSSDDSMNDKDLLEDLKHLEITRTSSWESEPIINLVDSLIVKALSIRSH